MPWLTVACTQRSIVMVCFHRTGLVPPLSRDLDEKPLSVCCTPFFFFRTAVAGACELPFFLSDGVCLLCGSMDRFLDHALACLCSGGSLATKLSLRLRRHPSVSSFLFLTLCHHVCGTLPCVCVYVSIFDPSTSVLACVCHVECCTRILCFYSTLSWRRGRFAQPREKPTRSLIADAAANENLDVVHDLQVMPLAQSCFPELGVPPALSFRHTSGGGALSPDCMDSQSETEAKSRNSGDSMRRPRRRQASNGFAASVCSGLPRSRKAWGVRHEAAILPSHDQVTLPDAPAKDGSSAMKHQNAWVFTPTVFQPNKFPTVEQQQTVCYHSRPSRLPHL